MAFEIPTSVWQDLDPKSRDRLSLVVGLSAIAQAEAQAKEEIKQSGPAKTAVERMAKYPHPSEVSAETARWLLMHSRDELELMQQAGDALPPGFAEWRRALYDRHVAELPIPRWLAFVEHPDLVPTADELRAAKGSAATPLVEKIQAAFDVFKSLVIAVLSGDMDTKDLKPEGLFRELFRDGGQRQVAYDRLMDAYKLIEERGLQIHWSRMQPLAAALAAKLDRLVPAAPDVGAGAYGTAPAQAVTVQAPGGPRAELEIKIGKTQVDGEAPVAP